MLHEVAEIVRDDLLAEKSKVSKDPQVIYVSEFHPVFKKLLAILKKHHHVLKNDKKLKDLFPTAPIVAFRRSKCIRNYVIHNDVSNGNGIHSGVLNSKTFPCGRCKLCKNVLESIPNVDKVHLSRGNCKSRNVIYGAWCKKHNQIYVGQTGEKLSDRFAKHRYDIKKRPSNSELAQHFCNEHNVDTDLGVVVLQQLKDDNSLARLYYEDH